MLLFIFHVMLKSDTIITRYRGLRPHYKWNVETNTVCVCASGGGGPIWSISHICFAFENMIITTTS